MRERIGGMGIKEGSVAYTLQYICAWEKKRYSTTMGVPKIGGGVVKKILCNIYGKQF